jgi:coenzyme F420-0:L-glutamate ligase/coenzyme F420-1:gamma-L-glutamate ligase
LPEVRPGDDLAGLIGQGIERAGLVLEAGDLIVLAQKIVSKAAGDRHRQGCPLHPGGA